MDRASAPRILCVSPLFPPTAHAESFVAAKWALALTARGADVTVISEPPYAGASTDDSPLWAPLAARTFCVAPPEASRPLATLALGLRYRVGRLYPRWIHRVVRQAEALHREKAFDVVASRSLPMPSHLAGYWCARALGVPWVAVVDDVWDLHLFVQRRVAGHSRDIVAVSNFWLRRTMKRADAVVVHCPRLGDYTRRLASSQRETDVIPFVGAAAALPPPSREFTMTHVGTLGREAYTGGRSSEALLRGVASLLAARPEARATFRVRLVGPSDPDVEVLCAELGLGDVVRATGRSSYARGLEEIAAATVGLVVEAKAEEGVLLVSKLSDYATARKPVLALSPDVGAIADLGDEPGIRRVGVEDAAGVARAAGELYDDWRAGRLDARRPSERLVREFDATAVADRFLAVVERVGALRRR